MKANKPCFKKKSNCNQHVFVWIKYKWKWKVLILIWRKSILIKAEFLLLSTRQTWHAHRYWSRPALASGTHLPEPLHTFLSQTEIPSTQSFALSTPAETWSQFQGGLPVAKNKREWMMLIKNCPILSLKQ